MEKAVLRKLTLLCVIGAVAVAVLLGMAALRDGKREWQQYQAEYKKLLLEKIGRDKNPVLYDRIAAAKPEIKQVVIDQWKTIDRCVTCHLGIDDPLFASAAQPYKTHPNPELLKQHPVEKFGCTICHGGQGMATTFVGSSHNPIENWPVTLVSKGLIQSRCGYCHKDYQAIGADRLVKGRDLYEEMHCSGCHTIDGVGGSVGPDLSAFADKDPSNFSMENLEGPKSKQNWVMEHFRDPKRVSPGSPMRTYAMNDDQIECLTSYVLSLNQREFPRAYTAKVRPDFTPPKVDDIIPEARLTPTEGEVEND
ncbi:MAG TPA: cytochrome c [Geobacteraceae bacterium]